MPTARRLASGILILAAIVACRIGTADTAGPVVVFAPQTSSASRLALPNRDGSLKFAVLGDFGNGSREQFELAAQMEKLRQRFPYTIVITVGDNIYGRNSADAFRRRFEEPYKPLLDAGVKFYASLGNHDDRELQRLYAPFNMDGKYYYSFKPPQQDVRFFALESAYLDVDHIGWIQKELTDSNAKWKIPYFHHPLYSSAGRHGSQELERKILEPLFIKYNVSVVFSGHDHTYERTKPQNGIVYFVVGSGGQLRRGDLEQTGFIAAGHDRDRAFLAVEIDGDEMFFNAISRTGDVVDSGVIHRRQELTQ